ncbi:NADPH-dependent 7-cyano-7-deazaguanine reductase [Pelistega europaea]|uniref:NADPH-dependent 7-cyano-7-deazaguanine reductase QueF n=1 Tax=Pelistega europaea TaxID=106147 RepID=A0A7Y4P4E9_9BURK|nr:NADPH-dependent 7-cyano-7-deazaguanine reductase [Pelistega europaea]NOL50007.1 NADPH-dependent 7-cyano-7-deazaguanine reductase QueF [Pelistega europaea]
MAIEQELNHAPLGKTSEYPEHYDPSLLFPIPRSVGRQHLSIQPHPTWVGEDVWRAFEVSWLNPKGKPEIAILKFTIPADSTHIIESKSFKLYLNSFNQEKIEWNTLIQRLKTDLSRAAGGDVLIEREEAHTPVFDLKTDTLIYPPAHSKLLPPEAHPATGTTFSEPHHRLVTESALLHATSLDALDVECHVYEPTASLLRADTSRHVREVLTSDLLKSNCPVTSQPDWGTVVISYEGNAIDHASLLQYIVSYRHHNGFHEQCVEQIYCDIMQQCAPTALEVYARYTRRGGLDINPRRASPNFVAPGINRFYTQSIKTPRQ